MESAGKALNRDTQETMTSFEGEFVKIKIRNPTVSILVFTSYSSSNEANKPKVYTKRVIVIHIVFLCFSLISITNSLHTNQKDPLFNILLK